MAFVSIRFNDFDRFKLKPIIIGNEEGIFLSKRSSSTISTAQALRDIGYKRFGHYQTEGIDISAYYEGKTFTPRRLFLGTIRDHIENITVMFYNDGYKKGEEILSLTYSDGSYSAFFQKDLHTSFRRFRIKHDYIDKIITNDVKGEKIRALAKSVEDRCFRTPYEMFILEYNRL